MAGDEAKEDTDSGQSRIAGSGTATPCVFQMIEELKHERFVDIFDTELLDVFVQCVGAIAQQQLNDVAVSQDGICRQAFLNRQVVDKEAFDEVGDVCHFSPP